MAAVKPARGHRPSTRSATAAIAESVVRLFAAPVVLEASYEGSSPAEDDLALGLVRAVASAHGGSSTHEEEPRGTVRLSLSLVLD